MNVQLGFRLAVFAGLLAAYLLSPSLPFARADDAADKKAAVGHWSGPLKVGAIELRLVFNIQQKSDGELTGTLDSIDQDAKDIPIDSISVEDGTLKIDIKRLAASFEGPMNAKGLIDGKFSQAGQTFPLSLKRSDARITLNRPQEPKPPFPYRAEEVVVDNAAAGVKLAGTLTLPEGNGPFPAVSLITGSGAQDRDEALMGHKPFAVLADHLTRQGIAVLRVDDRGYGKSTGNMATATSQDFKGDALACVAYLKSRKEIDPKKIGLCGHSEGGIIAPLAAVESGDVAFIVLMAGTGVTGEEILYEQGSLILKAMGAPPEELAKQKAVQQAMFAVVKAETDPDKIKERIQAAMDDMLSEKEKKELADNPGAAAGQVEMLVTPWFRYFLSYDPQPTLAKVKCPVLAINGEKDMQVSPSQNLPVIEKAVKSGGNQNITLREFPGLNHLFQTCTTGAPAEYGQIEETMNPAALNAISEWILAQTK